MKAKIKKAKSAAVPIIAVETADASATVRTVCEALDVAVLVWNAVDGAVHANSKAQALAMQLNKDGESADIVSLLKAVRKIEEEFVLIIENADSFFTDAVAVQAIWLCRDDFKIKGQMLVLFVPFGATIPIALKADILVFAEQMPSTEEIEAIVKQISEAAGIKKEVENKASVVDAVYGYPSAFAVEQALAVNVSSNGFNVKGLWETRITALKNLAGLELSLPTTTFANLAGLSGVKEFFSHYLHGRRQPRVVFLLDEIEKMVAASGTDMSGVTQALLEQFLFWTEEEKVDGALLLGIPGAGKTATAKAIAGEANIPLARGSMSTVKGSLVGQSEAQMRTLLRTVSALGQGRVLMLATCNNVESLPTEVQARFKLGTFFYDYPTEEELEALWRLYLAKFELQDEPPTVAKWVGREVESCCYRAWLFKVPVKDAVRYIVPISQSNTARLEALRKASDGKYLNAAAPGIWFYPQTQTTSRRIMQ